MPFLGPKKAAILQQLVEQQQPRLVVEVGSMAGYSAIVIAQVGGLGFCEGVELCRVVDGVGRLRQLLYPAWLVSYD